MNLQNIENYQRLFRHEGLRFLVNGIAIRGWKGLGAIAIVKDDDYVCYMPKSVIEKTSEEGLALFSSKEKFDSYFTDFRNFQERFINFCKEILSFPNISKTHVEKFLEFSIKSIEFYKRTEFIFTDKPYLESQKSNNQELKDNLKKFEKIKFEFRDSINLIFFGTESYYQKVLEKIEKNFNVSAEDLQQYSPKEVLELFDGKKLDKEIVKERYHRNILIDHDGDIRAYWGKQAEDIINNFLKDKEKSKEISGTVVNPGKAIGIVRIIKPAWHENFHRIREAMERMNKGDILVSETTAPEIMPAIKKAGAIVADQGGLMSHAAIMSRELNVPGIVGAGNATEVLKDGDLVEVDADNGMVKILEKTNVN